MAGRRARVRAAGALAVLAFAAACTGPADRSDGTAVDVVVPGPTTTRPAAPGTTGPIVSAPSAEQAAAAWAWGAAFLGGTPGPARGEPVLIGLIEQGGPRSSPEAVAGAEVAAAAVSDRFGGVRGRPLALRRCRAASAAEALDCARRLADEGVVAVVTAGLVTGGAEVHRALRRRVPVVVGAAMVAGDLEAPGAVAYTGGIGTSVPVLGIVASTFLDPKPVSLLALYSDDETGRDALDRLLLPILDAAGIGVEAVPVAAGAQEADVAATLVGAGIGSYDTVALLLDPGGCRAARDALARFTGERRVLTTTWCAGDLVAVGGLAGLPDGWHLAGDGYLPTLPHVASGNDAFLAASVVSGSPVWGLAGPMFASVLVTARILTDLVERTATMVELIDPAEVIDAFAAYDGPVPLQVGETACGHHPDYPALCATAGGAQRRSGGAWASLADGYVDPPIVVPVPR